MNQQRTNVSDVNTYVAPGQINALGLIDEVFHLVINQYYETNGKPCAMRFTHIWSSRLANPNCWLL